MNSEHYPEYYKPYIEKIPAGDPMYLLEEGNRESMRVLALISESQANYRYQEGKWSIKEIIQHLIDSERVFCFRAMSFARGEKQQLAGYDHDSYAQNSQADYRPLKDLLEEMQSCRKSTIHLFKSFAAHMMDEVGNANGLDISVAQILHVIIGHELHHIHVIQQKYLS